MPAILGVERAAQPLAGRSVVVGELTEIALEAADLGGLRLSLHEQHAGELDRRRVVEVLATFERTEDVAFGGRGPRPAVGQ